jgi:hypothetical protein
VGKFPTNPLSRAFMEIAEDAWRIRDQNKVPASQPELKNGKENKNRLPENLRCAWLQWQEYRNEKAGDDEFRRAVRMEKIVRIEEILRFQFSIILGGHFDRDDMNERVYVDEFWTIWLAPEPVEQLQ